MLFGQKSSVGTEDSDVDKNHHGGVPAVDGTHLGQLLIMNANMVPSFEDRMIYVLVRTAYVA